MVSLEQFFELITAYNNSFWPFIVLTYFLGIIVCYLAYKKINYSDKIVSGYLAFLWFWSGLIFWIGTFGPYSLTIFDISLPGIWIILGIAFIFQGCILIYYGIYQSSISFKIENTNYFYLGFVFVLFALVFYPVIGFITGHPYPDYPIFGISPCPITIFTFGMLLWTDKEINPIILIIPVVYAINGIIPLLMYSVLADLGLIVIGIVGAIVIVYRDRRSSRGNIEKL